MSAEMHPEPVVPYSEAIMSNGRRLETILRYSRRASEWGIAAVLGAAVSNIESGVQVYGSLMAAGGYTGAATYLSAMGVEYLLYIEDSRRIN